MNHDVLHFFEVGFDRVVRGFGDFVGFDKLELSIHGDFSIDIYAIAELARAQRRVYQNMPSLTAIDKTAAASAIIVGALAEAYDRVAMVSMLEYPMARPVPARIRPSISDATHSKRSWP